VQTIYSIKLTVDINSNPDSPERCIFFFKSRMNINSDYSPCLVSLHLVCPCLWMSEGKVRPNREMGSSFFSSKCSSSESYDELQCVR